MKKLIAVLALLVAVVAGGPFISGMLVEQRYQELLKEDAFSDVVIFHDQSYERSWLSSTMVTEVEVTEPQLMIAFKAFKKKTSASADVGSSDSRPSFKVKSIVQHGPFWFGKSSGMGLGRVDSRLILDDETRTKIDAVFEGEILSMQVTVNFGRTADVALNTSKATFADEKSGYMVTVQPVLSQWQVAELGSRIKGEIIWDGLNFSGKKGSATLAGTTIKTEMHQYHGLWVGSATLDQESVVLDGRQRKLSIRDLRLDADVGVNTGGDLVKSTMGSTVQSMNISGEMYGPGSCRISVANVPVDTLVKIKQLQNEMARTALHDPARYAASSVSMKMLALSSELLSRGPVIEISEMKITTPYGDVQGGLKIVLPEAAPERLMNPGYLKQVVQVDANLTVPVAYFTGAKTAQAADRFRQSGFVEEKDGMLHMTLHMADGKLSINGKPVPLPF